MYSNTADWSSGREGQLRRLTSSFLRVAKNVSAGRDEARRALGDDGVVVGVPAGAHRDRDPGLVRGAAERQTDVLAALVGVVDQPGLGAPAREGHLQRVEHEA
jgi:hypothetical protein